MLTDAIEFLRGARASIKESTDAFSAIDFDSGQKKVGEALAMILKAEDLIYGAQTSLQRTTGMKQ